MLNLIFFITMYPLIFLLYYIFKMEGKRKSTSLFGITTSSDWISKEECEKLEKEFCRKMNRNLIILALIPFITLLIPYMSIGMTIWMCWLFGAIVAFMQPYFVGHQKLKTLKKERIGDRDSSNIVYSELKNAGTLRAIKKGDCLAPVIISMLLGVCSLPALLKEINFLGNYSLYSFVIISYAFCTLLFYGCALWTDRQKTRVICNDSDTNLNYNRAVKKVWKNFWNLCMWSNTIFTACIFLILLLQPKTDILLLNLIIWGSIIYGILIIGFCFYLWKQKLLIDKHYEDRMLLSDRNEEDAWIGGIFYYNPKNKHTMVSKKYGIGTTVNLATKAGKASAVLSMVCMLIVPVMCIWLMMEEFTPISLVISQDRLLANHIRNEYSIPIDAIENLTLIEELPRSSKVNGTGMDTLSKGTFRNSNDGQFQCMLNPRNEVFLRFEADGTVYYMSGFDDTETRAIYEALH